MYTELITKHTLNTTPRYTKPHEITILQMSLDYRTGLADTTGTAEFYSQI